MSTANYQRRRLIAEVLEPRVVLSCDHVFLDPGHGGSDPGAVTPGGVEEADVALDLALQLRDHLEASTRGFTVNMTRSTDEFLEISERPAVAAGLSDEQERAFFLSIHLNSAAPSIRGTETFFRAAENDNLNLAEDEQFAQFIQTATFDFWEPLGGDDRGIKPDTDTLVGSLGVLNDTSLGNTSSEHPVVAALLEVEFLTNQEVETSLEDDDFVSALAEAIADGFVEARRAMCDTPPEPQPVGGEIPVNSVATGSQNGPQVAMNSTGDFVVAWLSDGQDGDGVGVFAQAYNAAGVPKGVEVQANQFTSGNQHRHSVAMDADGSFVIAWQSDNQGGVYARRFDATGNPIGNEFFVGSRQFPSVAMDDDGDFVIAWDNYNGTGSGDVYAQRFNADATRVGNPFRVNSYTSNEQWQPEVAMDADRDFVVTWHSKGQDGSPFSIFAQRYAADGTRQGSEFPVNTVTAGHHSNPNMDMDANGNFVITWLDANRRDSMGFHGLYARSYNADGTARGGEFPVQGYSVALGPANTFLTAGFTVTDGNYDVVAQRYDGDGNAVGGSFPVNTTTVGTQSEPSVAMNVSGDSVIVWSGKGTDDEQGIFARRFTLQTAAAECSAPPEELVSWWPGDDSAEDTADGNDGTLQNGAAFASGKVGQAFSLDGLDDFVQIPDSPNLTPNSLTVEAWVKPDSLTGVQVIASKYDSDEPSNGRSWVLDAENGRLQFVVYGEGNDRRGRISTIPVLSEGLWSHVAGTFDKATQQITVYVNGVAIPSSSVDAGGSVTIFDGKTPVLIGAFGGTANSALAPSAFWDGGIDEVTLYNRALSGSEVQSIFAADMAGKCTLTAPEVTVLHDGTEIADGQPTPIDFGAAVQGSTSPSKTFTVRNEANAARLFGIDTHSRELVTINTSTGAADGLCCISPALQSLAFDPNTNTLYATNVTSDKLTIIDTATRETTERSHSLGFTEVAGLAFDPDTNTLYGADARTDQLLRIDTSSGVGTAIGPLGFDAVFGLAFDPSTNTLFGTDILTDQLLIISTTTGAGTAVGPFGFGSVSSLAFDPTTSTLFGADNVTDELLTINTSTGRATVVGALGSPNIEGLGFGANAGDGAILTLGDGSSPIVDVPPGFILIDDLIPELAPGEQDTFTVQLDTTTVGAKSGEISFATNDSDENPFDFSITGEVTPSRITIITHGFATSIPPWVVDMATAINREAPFQCTHRQIDDSRFATGEPPRGNGCPFFLLPIWDSHNVLIPGPREDAIDTIYDWVTDRLDTQGQVDFHFIGHSRGAVVNSEVVERLKESSFTSQIDDLHVTMLDPRPVLVAAGPDPDPVIDTSFVDFADNYFQQSGELLIPEGRPIAGAVNIDLTSIVESWEARSNNPLVDSGDHGEVHDWYHWTIDTNQQPLTYNDVPDPDRSILFPASISSWTHETGGDRAGFYWAVSQGGFDSRPEPIAGTNVPVTISSGDSNISVDANPPSTVGLPNATFPLGHLAVEVSGLETLKSTSLTFYVPPETLLNTVFKYGKPDENSDPQWFEFLFDETTQTGAVIEGNIVTVHYVDGKRGDDDFAENGIVIDPVSPAFVPPVPSELDLTDESDTGRLSDDNFTGDSTPTLQTLAFPGLTVDFYVSGIRVATATESAPGVYEAFFPEGSLRLGANIITATASDGTTTSASSDPTTVTFAEPRHVILDRSRRRLHYTQPDGIEVTVAVNKRANANIDLLATDTLAEMTTTTLSNRRFRGRFSVTGTGGLAHVPHIEVDDGNFGEIQLTNVSLVNLSVSKSIMSLKILGTDSEIVGTITVGHDLRNLSAKYATLAGTILVGADLKRATIGTALSGSRIEVGDRLKRLRFTYASTVNVRARRIGRIVASGRLDGSIVSDTHLHKLVLHDDSDLNVIADRIFRVRSHGVMRGSYTAKRIDRIFSDGDLLASITADSVGKIIAPNL